MTNRILGILIILGFVGVGYLYYTLGYLPNKHNTPENEINEEVNEENEKKIELIKIKKEEKEKVTISNQEKIEQIKLKNQFYKIIDLKGNNKVYFKENGNKLDLLFGTKFIGSFDVVYKKDLRVEFIIGDYNTLYIEVGNYKYLYNIGINKIVKLDLNINVLYIKKGQKDEFLFVTEKGTFIYKIYYNEFEYFSFFNDFIYSDDGYIGVLNKDDNRRLKNMGFEAKNQNLIIYYNPNTKEKKILFKTDIKIDKIYIKNNQIYIFDYEGNEYVLNK